MSHVSRNAYYILRLFSENMYILMFCLYAMNAGIVVEISPWFVVEEANHSHFLRLY